MGEFNSSVTRVWPVFDWLLRSDPTGSAWLTTLLRLGSRVQEAEPHILSDPGPLCARLVRRRPLPGLLRSALGAERATRVGSIRIAYEKEIPPPAAFLRWLLEHPEQLSWPRTASGDECIYSAGTQKKRKCLLAGDPSARQEALEKLDRFGASGSRQKWWAFEGFTSVDCILETKSLLLLIEGKRTDSISKSTDWFPSRNQVIRNIEVAQELADGRNFAVLLCAETETDLPAEAWKNSLPHLSPAAIKELKRRYLGYVTWPTIAQRLCPGLTLPEKVDDAIELLQGIRC